MASSSAVTATIVDVVIPTLKPIQTQAATIAAIEATAGIPVRVYATCQPVSASKNRNLGLDQATGSYIVMLDDDIEQFPQGWVKKLVDVLQNHPNCAMVSPQLARPDGSPGFMMGGVTPQRSGLTAATERKLPTACVAIRRNGLRFDERFIGSGWEDDDYCAQLRAANPSAEFFVCHDVWVVHRNEMKNQRGPHWQHNKNLFQSKWHVMSDKHQ